MMLQIHGVPEQGRLFLSTKRKKTKPLPPRDSVFSVQQSVMSLLMETECSGGTGGDRRTNYTIIPGDILGGFLEGMIPFNSGTLKIRGTSAPSRILEKGWEMLSALLLLGKRLVWTWAVAAPACCSGHWFCGHVSSPLWPLLPPF